MTMVRLSVAESDSTGADGAVVASYARSEALALTLAYFRQLKSTSSASSKRPLVGARASHLILGRSFRVTCSLSALSSHDSTASPSVDPSACLGYVGVTYLS